MFDLAVGLWVIDGSIIELDAHVFAPEFYLIGRKVRVVISDDAVGDAIMVYNPRYKVYHRSGFGRLNRLGFYPFGELIHHDQQVFFLVGSSLKGSNHVKPPDRKGPSHGDSLEGVGWHMALVCEKLATNAALD